MKPGSLLGEEAPPRAVPRSEELLEAATGLLREANSNRPATLYGILRLLVRCREARDWAQGERIFSQARAYLRNSSRLWLQGARLAREQGLLSTADNRLQVALQTAERNPHVAELGHFAVLLHEAGASPGRFWSYWDTTMRGRFADLAAELCGVVTTLGSEERTRLYALLRRPPPLSGGPWKHLFRLLLRTRSEKLLTSELQEYPEVLALGLRARASLSRGLAEAAAWQHLFCRNCAGLAGPEHHLELAEKYHWLGRGLALEESLQRLPLDPDGRVLYLKGQARILQGDCRGALELWHDNLHLQHQVPEVADTLTRLLEDFGTAAELLEHLRRNPQLSYSPAYLSLLVHGLQPWREEHDGARFGAEIREQAYARLNEPDCVGHSYGGIAPWSRPVRLQTVYMCPAREADTAAAVFQQLHQVDAFFRRELGSASPCLEFSEPVRLECPRPLSFGRWREWLRGHLPGRQSEFHYLVLDAGRPRLQPRSRIHPGWGAQLQLSPFSTLNVRLVAAALARSLFGLRPPPFGGYTLLEPVGPASLARTYLSLEQRLGCSTTPETQAALEQATGLAGEQAHLQLRSALRLDPWHRGIRRLLKSTQPS